MKYKTITALCLVGMLLADCAQQKKVVYEFPAAMSATTRAGFTTMCDKGKILYDINCARCHNIRLRRKEVIPDFTDSQLHAYELRISNPQHESNMSDTKVTTEELGNICFFLTYKKKTRVPMKPSAHPTNAAPGKDH